MCRICIILSSIAFFVLSATGCQSIGTAQLTSQIQAVPADMREDMHVFFINSPLDQLHMGRLGDVTQYVREAGFPNSSYKHWAEGSALARELLHIRNTNPDARIALVAWSGGSLTVWDATTELNSQNQIVDCIVYLDSNWIKGRIEDRGHPDNVVRIVCIYNESREPPAGLPTATVYRVPTGNHMAVPTHPDAVQALVDELIATATQSRF